MVIPIRIRERPKRRVKEILLSLHQRGTFSSMMCSPFENHGGLHDNGYWKAYKQQIGNHITGAHGNQLRKSLAAGGSRVRDELPVAVKWLTFGQGCHDHSYKGESEEPSNELQDQLVGSFPHLAGQTLQKLGNGELCDPQAFRVRRGPQQGRRHLQSSIHDPRHQDKLAPNFSMPNLEGR